MHVSGGGHTRFRLLDVEGLKIIRCNFNELVEINVDIIVLVLQSNESIDRFGKCYLRLRRGDRNAIIDRTREEKYGLHQPHIKECFQKKQNKMLTATKT